MKLFYVPKNLTNDPYNKRGKVGFLVETKDEDLQIEFLDGTRGWYQSDAIEEMDEDFTIDRIFNTSATILLKLIALKKYDARDLAIEELNRRGYNEEGKFIGFKR